KQLGYKWMVMTDWWSVYDGEKVAKSGQDLEMPLALALKNADSLINEAKIRVSDIDRMVKSILRTYFAMKLNERKKDPSFEAKFPAHESIALQTARDGIVLLKNDGNILPIRDNVKTILITGDYVEKLAVGGGSAAVKGYDIRLMGDELRKVLGDRMTYVKNPTVEQIKSAEIVLCNVGTEDSEGRDRPFDLPQNQEALVEECVNNNPNTVVIVTSGSGIKMTQWNARAKAIIYAWYLGQAGNTALAEIIGGMTNPSGKLPISIEKDFEDSPGFGYIPAGESLYTGWNGPEEKAHPVFDIKYNEGIFVGYRWYDEKNIEPLYPFGYGLSYTKFEYSDLTVSKEKFEPADVVEVRFTVKNVGTRKGAEIAQLYVHDVASSLQRPVKELKGFRRIELDAGQSAVITLELSSQAFSYWNPASKGWFEERGNFVLQIGSSSRDIKLQKEIELL
ncbi:MAG TPA: glycoside hydrolase family 3 C-terminal domain-containing protein, partial [Bacteroidota bacterium]|nr:glycoside hydrolase family 3 C-terminal domain-containing protein [Bacteroidota bacterium]